MAEEFPMSLTQLLPVLEVISNANKHIGRVAKFLQKYGDMSLFPVKLQVSPVLQTLGLQVISMMTADLYKVPVVLTMMFFSKRLRGRRIHDALMW